MNHRGPLPLRELHSTDETLVWRDPGDLEPVYDLFTIMGEIIPSESLSRVTYTGILRRQSSPIYEVLERTEQEKKKRGVEEDPRESP